MLQWELLRRLRSLIAPEPRGARPAAQAGMDLSALGIAANRLPVSGAAAVQWATAIRLSLEPDELPTYPAVLAARLTLARGYAGVGWYDVDGPAEEIHVGPGPCTRDVHLTLWNPGLFRTLVIRSVRRQSLAVTLEGLDWLPLKQAQASPRWRASLDGLPDDCFLDTPFKGVLSESLSRRSAGGRWLDPDLRMRRLKRLVSLAWEHCPGYRAWWSRHGWHPSDLRSLEEADAIPPIDKERMRADLDAFSLPRRSPMIASTSGSTGEPFSFRYTAALRLAHHAQAAVACARATPDLSLTQTRLMLLSGRPLRGLSATGAAGSLVLSHAALGRPEALLELIEAYRPAGLYAFPSSAAKLAEVLDGRYRFRSAILSSESMLPFQLRAAERIADTVTVTYGLSEGAAFALRCPSCGTYGELPSHGLTTLRRRPDGLHDIVGTGFWSLGTLFIGYATGDLTAGRAEPCPDCPGGGLRFSAILGREQEALLDRNNVRYTLGLLYRVLVPDMPRIKLYDFVQDEPGQAILRYITHDGHPLGHEAVERALRHVVPTLAIELRMAPEIAAMHDALPPATKWKLVKTTVRVGHDGRM